MREQTEQQKQQYQRYTEIFNLGKQRYINAVGNAKGYHAGARSQDYLTDEERSEAKALLRQMFDTSAKEMYIKKSGLFQNTAESLTSVKGEIKQEG